MRIAHTADITWSTRGLLAAIALAAMLVCPAIAPAATDQVKFADEPSEQAHAFAGKECPASAGGLGEPCRRIAPGGALVFDLACDPDRQNYLTVRFWGSDTEVATLFLYDGNKRIGAYGNAWPELDLGGEAALPGRFYYATYTIPRPMTVGKKTVTLKLGAVGSLSPYAADPAKRENPQKGLTRGIYRAYAHTDPFFTPSADEPQGAPPKGALRPKPQGFPSVDRLHGELDDAVDRLMKWQLYGPAWDEAAAKGAVPAVVIGAVARGGNPAATRTASEWKNFAVAPTTGNCVPMNALAVFAKAYKSPWSSHRGKAELVDRVARGLDFCSAAQGSNGAFTSRTWVGGPDRRPGNSCLEGFGTNALGRAFLLLADDPAFKRLLDAETDADGDPATPKVPRRAAWAAMFERHRDFLVSREGRGHATNQDLAQMTAMWLANESLRSLAPDKAWPRAKALEYVYAAVGLAECPLGGFWVTRKGLCLEPWGTLGGGYCGNYGLGAVPLVSRLAELTGDEKVRRRATEVVHTAAPFYFPSVDAEGYFCMRKEEIVSTRNTKWPCRVDYGGDEWVAAVCGDPVALRAAQLMLDHGRQPTLLPESNGHFVDSVTDTLFHMEHFERLLALPPAAFRLPMEDTQPDFAWADEQAATVAVKHRGLRLYMVLNWRRGFQGDKRDAQHTQANNIARIHCLTPAFDRIATIAMESPQGFGKFYICRYGPYLVGMNLTADTPYRLPLPAGLASAVDLVSGQPLDAKAADVPVPPSTTRVVYLGTP